MASFYFILLKKSHLIQPRNALGVDSCVHEHLGFKSPGKQHPPTSSPSGFPQTYRLVPWAFMFATPVPRVVIWDRFQVSGQGCCLTLPGLVYVRARGWMQWILCVNACGNELKWSAWTKVTRLSWKAQIICFIFHRHLVPFWELAIKLFYNRKYVGLVRLLPEVTSMNNEQWADLSKVSQVKTQLR